MLGQPMRRLTLFLPVSLHEMIEAAAKAEYSRPSEFARRQLARAVQPRKRDEADDED